MKKKKKNRKKKTLPPIIALIIALCICAFNYMDDPGSDDLYRVTRVVDGDTIVVHVDGTDEKVRLIGVDTPESVHPNKEKNVPYGKVASAFTKETLLDQKVRLEFDAEERDRYGRLLAYVYKDDKMFNLTLVQEGHAKVATYPPNVKYTDTFVEAQKKARAAGKGLWGK